MKKWLHPVELMQVTKEFRTRFYKDGRECTEDRYYKLLLAMETNKTRQASTEILPTKVVHKSNGAVPNEALQ